MSCSVGQEVAQVKHQASLDSARSCLFPKWHWFISVSLCNAPCKYLWRRVAHGWWGQVVYVSWWMVVSLIDSDFWERWVRVRGTILLYQHDMIDTFEERDTVNACIKVKVRQNTLHGLPETCPGPSEAAYSYHRRPAHCRGWSWEAQVEDLPIWEVCKQPRAVTALRYYLLDT